MTRRALPAKVDAESLLRIPLVRAAFSHPTLAPKPRAVDLRWHYEGVVPRGLSGFVPLGGDVYYGRHSRTADWLARPAASARAFNEDDHLAREVLFCVHDHLHAWALSAVEDVAPEMVIRPGLRERDREALAFVHLATEAAATVGLDYWYLSAVELDTVCAIGTLVAPLTTSYHERYLAEYRRFRPDLVVQTPAFLEELARFYCDGAFVGFDGEDIARSPRLAPWLRHEVLYGEGQRVYVREWLAFLTRSDAGDARRPVRADASWQRKLLRVLAERLWAYVKDGVDHASARTPTAVRREGGLDRFDPRFVNVRTMGEDELRAASRRETDPARRALLCEQLVSSYDFSRFDRDLLPALVRAVEAKDVAALFALLRDVPRVRATPDEPHELFLLG